MSPRSRSTATRSLYQVEWTPAPTTAVRPTPAAWTVVGPLDEEQATAEDGVSVSEMAPGWGDSSRVSTRCGCNRVAATPGLERDGGRSMPRGHDQPVNAGFPGTAIAGGSAGVAGAGVAGWHAVPAALSRQ